MHNSVKYILLAIFLVPYSFLQAQQLEGTVYELNENKIKAPLFGVNIQWKGTAIGTSTDENGKFKIARTDTSGSWLLIRHFGYTPDTIFIKDEKKIEIILSKGYQAATVVVEAERKGNFLSKVEVGQREVITEKEILRAACCNLSESFETNASVDVNFTDAVSGAKQIKMLGLDGVYSQLMRENVPTFRGLAGAYGLSFIPGTYIESIQITKGAGTVVNGYESMAGQINLELKKATSEKLYFNLYGDAMGRTEANLNLSHKFNDKLSSALLTHGSNMFVMLDRNKDGFMDVPKTGQLSFLNRWEYFDGKKLESQFGISGLVQSRTGGQMHFTPAHKLSDHIYGIGVDITRWEGFVKTGLVFPEKPYKSVGLILSGTYHDQTSYFGLNQYSGKQNTLYANLIYQSIIGSTDHKIKFGGSLLADRFKETFIISKLDSAQQRAENVPGVFGEYTYSYKENFSAVAGARLDYHNLFGLMFTPRVHFRYHLTENTTLRASAGKGYRTPNIFTENISFWASSRKLVIQEKPGQEQSINYGGSLNQDFKFIKRKGALTIDFFRTEFQQQVVADLDQHSQYVYIYMLKGKSFANSFQAEVSYEPAKNIEIRSAYKYYDVKTTYHGQLLQRPLVPTQRFLTTASYSTKYKKYIFDATALWYGKSRLPNTESSPEIYRLAAYSPNYWIFHFQITRNFKKWSVYGGTENIMDYRQQNPIVSANDPFGPHFDASMVWGPVDGRRIYFGLRYKIDRK